MENAKSFNCGDGVHGAGWLVPAGAGQAPVAQPAMVGREDALVHADGADEAATHEVRDVEHGLAKGR